MRVDIVGMPKFTPAELKKIRKANIKIGGRISEKKYQKKVSQILKDS